MNGMWRADTGSSELAAKIAVASPGLLADHTGKFVLPGKIEDAGGGWLQFDELTRQSLAIYRIRLDEDETGQLLTGPDDQLWPLQETGVF